eukprot:760372-Prymnesium_polylepis.2
MAPPQEATEAPPLPGANNGWAAKRAYHGRPCCEPANGKLKPLKATQIGLFLSIFCQVAVFLQAAVPHRE